MTISHSYSVMPNGVLNFEKSPRFNSWPKERTNRIKMFPNVSKTLQHFIRFLFQTYLFLTHRTRTHSGCSKTHAYCNWHNDKLHLMDVIFASCCCRYYKAFAHYWIGIWFIAFGRHVKYTLFDYSLRSVLVCLFVFFPVQRMNGGILFDWFLQIRIYKSIRADQFLTAYHKYIPIRTGLTVTVIHCSYIYCFGTLRILWPVYQFTNWKP